jgi:hypothetical protein
MTPLDLFNGCLRGPWTTAGDDVQYKVESDNRGTVCYFQCTASRSDWLANFDIAVTPYRDMPVRWYAHRGFVRLYKSIREEVLAKAKAAAGGLLITYAGYSQGAAIATLALEDAVFEGLDAQAHAFGSPRVVWMPPKEVRDRFFTLHRWSVRGDIVTMVPPFYRHVGNPRDLGKWALPSTRKHYPDAYREALEHVR